MALILHIETGTDVCSVALSEDNKVISLRESGSERDHATKLGVYINDVLTEHNYTTDKLDAISVGMGPGSYTGLRIGVSMAKGLCYALNIPLIGVNSLESMAAIALESYKAGDIQVKDWDNALLCPMIDARRMEVYTQVLDTSLNPITDVCAEIITDESFSEEINKTKEFLIFGNGAAKTVEILSNEKVSLIDITTSAKGLVNAAHKAYLNKDFKDLAYFEPFYLKDFVAMKSTKKMF